METNGGSAADLGNDAVPRGNTESLQALHDLSIAIALDISGSTAGAKLEAEKGAIANILSAMPLKSRDTVTVLPWDSSTYAMIHLPSESRALWCLHARVGTMPSLIVQDARYLGALRECSAWFLFTDGEIASSEMHVFSQLTSQAGLHGYPNIVVIFGDRHTNVCPGEVDFSVGLTTYALSPHALFVFHDFIDGNVYLMQAKGCFTCLLPNGKQTVLGSSSTWFELPQISYQDLAQVKIPRPLALSDGQIAFGDGLIVRLEDVYAGRVTKEVQERLINPGNLQAMSMQALSNGSSKRFESWSEELSESVDVLPELCPQRLDIGGRAKYHLQAVMKLLQDNAPDSDLRVETQRRKLRAAHEQNWASLRQHTQNYHHALKDRRAPLQSASGSSRRARLSNNMSAKTSFAYFEENNDSNAGFGQVAGAAPSSSAGANAKECFLPGFFKTPDVGMASTAASYVEQCKICHVKGVQVLLLKVQNPLISHDSLSSVQPVLTVNLTSPEDTNAAAICCDSCAFWLIQPDVATLSGPVTGSLPMVSSSHNWAAWTVQVSKAFDINCLSPRKLLDCVTALNDRLTAMDSAQVCSVYRNAVLWMVEDLTQMVDAEASGSVEVQGAGNEHVNYCA